MTEPTNIQELIWRCRWPCGPLRPNVGVMIINEEQLEAMIGAITAELADHRARPVTVIIDSIAYVCG